MAEQTTGIIVGCMPVLPAFFRHVSRKGSKSLSFKSRSETGGAGPTSSSLVYHNARSTKVKSNDPFLLSREYEELDDLENGRRVLIDMRRTKTTVMGAGLERSLPEPSLASLQDSQSPNQLDSKTVQVTAQPCALEENPSLPLSAHVRE